MVLKEGTYYYNKMSMNPVSLPHTNMNNQPKTAKKCPVAACVFFSLADSRY